MRTLRTAYAGNVLFFYTLDGAPEDHEDRLGELEEKIQEALEGIPGVRFGEMTLEVDECWAEEE